MILDNGSYAPCYGKMSMPKCTPNKNMIFCKFNCKAYRGVCLLERNRKFVMRSMSVACLARWQASRRNTGYCVILVHKQDRFLAAQLVGQRHNSQWGASVPLPGVVPPVSRVLVCLCVLPSLRPPLFKPLPLVTVTTTIID